MRQALALAIDRDIITQNILAAGQVPAYSLIHCTVAGYEVSTSEFAELTQAERDARAVELMTEVGYGPGDETLNFDILFNTSDAHQSIAVVIGQMWKQKLGVETTLANQEWQTFLDTRGTQQYELARAGWCADYNEASSFLDIKQSDSGYNHSKFVNAGFDARLAEANLVEDPLPLYQQAEAILVREFPLIPIHFYSSVLKQDDTVKGYPLKNDQENWYACDMYRVATE